MAGSSTFHPYGQKRKAIRLTDTFFFNFISLSDNDIFRKSLGSFSGCPRNSLFTSYVRLVSRQRQTRWDVVLFLPLSNKSYSTDVINIRILPYSIECDDTHPHISIDRKQDTKGSSNEAIANRTLPTIGSTVLTSRLSTNSTMNSTETAKETLSAQDESNDLIFV